MASVLDHLRDMTTVVADTGDMEAIKALEPIDCTTNPSILLKVVQSPASEERVAKAIEAGKAANSTPLEIADRLTIEVGTELTKIVPGRVSTEVDAELSFDRDRSVEKARAIIAAYEEKGVSRDRILIKLASTWEGIRAAEILEGEGIQCNLTLLFCLEQAIACADAGVFLISPFVGRITDWYSKKEGKSFEPSEDPGVLSVRRIYDYYKTNGIDTVVMGASFRNTGQIKALAGCDRLTISPALLQELAEDQSGLERQLSPERAKPMEKQAMAEADFRWGLNADPMAAEKLAEGIRNFHADHQRLLKLIADRLAA